MMFAVGAALCCVALGLNSGAAARRRLQRLEEGVEVLQRMHLALEERRTLGEVLATAGNGPVGRQLAAMADHLANQPLLSPAEIWSAPWPEPESSLWVNLMTRLGCRTLEYRLQAVQQTERQLARLLDIQRQREEQMRPLRRSLSGLGGLAVWLLLW